MDGLRLTVFGGWFEVKVFGGRFEVDGEISNKQFFYKQSSGVG